MKNIRSKIEVEETFASKMKSQFGYIQRTLTE